MTKNIFIAGHKGMVGSAIKMQLEKDTKLNIIIADKNDLDLTNQSQTLNFFKKHNIHQVYLAAAKVGGIHANNTYPAEFIYQNLMIQSNVIHSAYLTKVKRLLFLGSSCIYPKENAQPIAESSLLTGALEPTNEPYAVAKIAGIKLCESYNRQYGSDFRSVMPTNLYGSNDNYHPENSHVIPALIRRIYEAKQENLPEVTIWGSGEARREFLYVDDMADACIHIMNLKKETLEQHCHKMQSHINVGTGIDISIKELACLIKQKIGYTGKLSFDLTKPDGTMLKKLDVNLIKTLGWQHKYELRAGLSSTIEYYKTIDKLH